jgi:drug/metabolite transporter (DMT)-like permease
VSDSIPSPICAISDHSPVHPCEVTIFFLGPIFTMISARVALGEPVSTVDAVAALVSFVGVALVAQSSPSRPDSAYVAGFLAPAAGRSAGIASAVAAAVLSAAAYTVVRKMNSSVHFMFNVFILGLASIVISTFAMGISDFRLVARLNPGGVTIALLLLQGVAAFAGQCALNEGLQHCRGVGVLIRNIDVPLAYIVGILVLGEVPAAESCVGAVLVFGAVVGLTLRQAVRS